jgi:hypothetical protein
MYANLYIWAVCSLWHCNLYNHGRSVFGVPKWILRIMVHIHNRWADSRFSRLVHRLSTQWPGICVRKIGNEKGFFSECFYFLLPVSFHQLSIFINPPPPPWRFGSIPSHGPPLTGHRDHTQTLHTLQDSSGRVISPTQIPLLDNTQHSLETNIHLCS